MFDEEKNYQQKTGYKAILKLLTPTIVQVRNKVRIILGKWEIKNGFEAICLRRER